jgi:hypothetical protein
MNPHRSIGPALLALVGAAAASAAEPAPGYTFKLDGRAITPTIVSLHGTPDRPHPGDLVEVDGYWLTLGTETTQEFRTTPRETGLLLAVLPGGRTEAVGARVGRTFKGDERVTIDPLKELSPDELARLRGVTLGDWPDGIGDRLRHLDPARACVTISGDTARGKEGALPPLPAGLRYLRVDENTNVGGIQDYSRLLGLKELRFLSIRSMTGPVDCAALRNAGKLEYLQLHAWKAVNFDRLEALAALRHLDLAYNEHLRAIPFARAMTGLRSLDVSRTGVADLRPLDGLKELAAVRASRSPVRALPARVPALRSLEVMSTRLADADAAAFAGAHPACRVLFRWDRALADALTGVDRVRVRTGGTCHRRPEAEKTLFEEKDAARVGALVGAIQVDEAGSGFHCGCCGEPSIEFYQGGTLLLTLGYHHDRSVRWVGGWPGDALLTARSAEHLKGWLAANVPEIRQAQEAARAAAKREAEAVERFVGHFPEKVRPWLRAGAEVDPIEGDKALGRQIAAAVPDEKARLVAACRAFGTLDGRSASWRATTGKERRVLAAVGGAGGEAFLRALEEVKDDRAALLGAARLFFFEDFDERIPAGARAEWTARLAEVALADGSDDNKLLVLRALARQTDPATGTLLREVMLGKKGTAIAEGYADEPGPRAAAALGLALRQEKDVAPEVAKLLAQPAGKPDVAACQVALALLGDPAQLRAEHFELRSYTIGYGAVRAVERFGGRHGLDLLIDHGLRHPWAAVCSEAERAVERITGRQFPEEGRGQAIRAWWKEHGPAFVEQKRKGTRNPR